MPDYMSADELSGDMQLKDWLNYLLENYVKPVAKPSAYEHYRDNCEKHIIPRLGQLSLNEITPRILQNFLNRESKTGNLRTGGPLSTKSMRNMRVVLDVAMKQALAEDIIHSNPVPLTVIKSCRTKRPQIMTDGMQEQLERYLFEEPNGFHPAILLALYTGLRRGEICALRWKNYNGETGRLSIQETVRRLNNYDAKPGEPKTKLVFNEVKTESSQRELTMPPVLRELLERQRLKFAKEHRIPTGEDFIFFSRTGGVMDPDNLQHYFSKLLKKLGLEHVKFHAIRHTFATRAIENGIDVSTVSGILGHADVTTTTHFYVHPREKAMSLAMQSIAPIYEPGKKDDELKKSA